MPTGSCNAELVRQLTPEMQEKLRDCGTPVTLSGPGIPSFFRNNGIRERRVLSHPLQTGKKVQR